MDVQFKIQRFDPEADQEPYFQTYRVSVEPTDRILDGLNRIKWEQDGTLGYRMSCGHGVCGSDAMKINGRCSLSCQKLIKEYEEQEIVLEPLPSFRVEKDLIVDLTPFFERVQWIRPYLIPASDPPEKERQQRREERQRLDTAIRCILCASCTASCPVVLENENYLGPAPLVWAFRYIFDSRDGDVLKRLKQVDDPDGAWACVNHFECTRVCPKEIPVTKSINTIKREIKNVLKKASYQGTTEGSDK
jgi:succinate dehydrogenase / fumarate reductase iron-sulfur subunit